MDAALLELARKYVWWLPPERAWERPELVLAQLLELGDWADVNLARRLLGDDALKRTLRHAPPGVIGPRSWNYWHLFFGIEPVPPMPVRPLPA